MSHARIRGGQDLSAYPVAVLGVSVGQAYHEGEKLRAMVGIVNKRFKKCVIDLSDSLQRHNLDLPPDQAMATAVAAGDAWLARNSGVLGDLNVPHRIYRWNNWLEHATPILWQFEAMMTTDQAFNKSVMDDARAYAERHGKTDANSIANSMRFILEEAAVMVLQSRLLPHAKLYPSHEMPTLARIRSQEFAHAPRGLEKSIYCRVTL